MSKYDSTLSTLDRTSFLPCLLRVLRRYARSCLRDPHPCQGFCGLDVAQHDAGTWPVQNRDRHPTSDSNPVAQVSDVHYDAVEVATKQLRIQEPQRVFGFIPNFEFLCLLRIKSCTSSGQDEIPACSRGCYRSCDRCRSGLRLQAGGRYGQRMDRGGARTGNVLAQLRPMVLATL